MGRIRGRRWSAPAEIGAESPGTEELWAEAWEAVDWAAVMRETGWSFLYVDGRPDWDQHIHRVEMPKPPRHLRLVRDDEGDN